MLTLKENSFIFGKARERNPLYEEESLNLPYISGTEKNKVQLKRELLMASDLGLMAQHLNITWDNILKWFPNTRLAIIARHPDKPERLIVERTSPEQLKNFPDLEGKICYEHVNGFPRPCPWCPVLPAIEDQQIHVAMARSPVPKRKADGSFSYEPDMGEMVYAILVAIPFGRGDDGVDRALEISFDRTKNEGDAYERRTQEYKFEATLCRSIEETRGEDTANEFILFGAVAEAGMGFREADLFLLGDGNCPDALSTLVSQRLTLTRDKETLPKLKLIENVFLSEVPGADLASLRGNLFPLIGRIRYETSHRLEELLSEYRILEPQRLKGQFGIPAGIMVRSDCAVAPLIGHHRKLHGVLLVKCHKGTLISDEDLVDLGIFALFVNHALTSRGLTLAYGEAVKKMEELTQQFGDTSEDLIYTGAIVTGLGHDLLNSHRDLRDFINMLIAEIPWSKQTSEPIKAIITEVLKLLEFQKKCLARVTDTARAAKPLFGRHNMAKLIEDVKDSFKHTLSEERAEIEIENHLSPKDKLVECDEFLIRQVLINLIENTLYWVSHTPKKKITIELCDINDQHIQIDYKDTGPGIAPEIRDEVWKPFFTIKPGGGLGLGLTITQHMIEKHGGTIQLYSKSGFGACFRIQLPLKQQKKGR